MADHSAASKDSGFQLAGSGPASYDRYVQVFVAPFVEAVIERAALERGTSVLDVACGTGFVARAASAIVGPQAAVAGLDINAEMIEMARSLAPQNRLSIEWHHASALEMPFADARFHAVLCSYGIMFFPDLRKGIREMARVAAPDGRVVVSFWTPLEKSPYFEVIRRRLSQVLPDGSTAFMDQAGATEPEEVADAFRESGLGEVRGETLERTVSIPPISEFLPGHVASLPCAGEFGALAPATREQVCDEVAADLAAHRDGEGLLRVPFAAYIVSGARQ